MTINWKGDQRLDYDLTREVFLCSSRGFEIVDSCSADAFLLDAIRNHRPEMRFRLTYDGPLLSSANKPRVQEKWDIRKQLHPQLAELWKVHSALQGYAMAYRGVRVPTGGMVTPGETATISRIEENRERLHANTMTVRGHLQPFLPLVRQDLFLTCTLDILFLRKDPPGSVVEAGDLDNRLTTLFDGLRMPKDVNEMKQVGELGVDPFYCLLEDDKLVTSLTVRTDRLLSRPDAAKDEVRLVVDVVVSPTQVKIDLNSGFMWD